MERDGIQAFLAGASTEEVAASHFESTQDWMDMGITECREGDSSMKVENLRSRVAVLEDLLQCSCRDDPAVFDGYGIGPRGSGSLDKDPPTFEKKRGGQLNAPLAQAPVRWQEGEGQRVHPCGRPNQRVPPERSYGRCSP